MPAEQLLCVYFTLYIMEAAATVMLRHRRSATSHARLAPVLIAECHRRVSQSYEEEYFQAELAASIVYDERLQCRL